MNGSFRAPGPGTTPAPARAREIVCRRLARQAELFPDLDLSPLFTPRSLDQRDAALAHAIYDAAIRRWITLAFLIEAAAGRPFANLEPPMRAVLLAGAAQLLLLDRIPAHAAINESVNLAKLLVRPGAGALANAVLRRVAALIPDGRPRREAWTGQRDELPHPKGGAVVLGSPLLPESPLHRLAVATSHPDWLIRRWSAGFGDDPAAELALHSLASPPVILNTSFARDPPGGLTPHMFGGHHVLTGARTDLAMFHVKHPDLWVQDPASSAAVASTAHLSPRVIVDFCAGQGTKTGQLAAQFPDARVVAGDIDRRRARALAETFGGHPRVEVMAPGRILAELAGAADLVVLDVPCSNTGVLARRAEAKYRCSPAQLARLVALQRTILEQGAALAGEGGRVLYSTCSIDREENEEQVEWAAGRFGHRVEGMRLLLPRGLPGGEPGGYHDGSFSAVLGRAVGA